ncbi:hypothetical protein [Larkinella rosea]|uniref:Uncharacterized protein n=1 Tax=Larkinella rosea TaxID=2025312 RepID=A0A3P1C2V8_9BACT|nr:hypothetical protein [Larkinella rosea]RRB07393.1 hypothetical protein EHT25_06330 [Larkinella rosea]
MSYFLGGYFLLKIKPFDWSPIPEVYTCSTCINDSLLNTWSYRWVNERVDHLNTAEELVGLNSANVTAIRHWTDKKLAVGEIGYPNVFMDLNTAREYRQKFFPHLDSVKLLAMYFDEPAAEAIIQELKPKTATMGECGLDQMLSRKVPENEDNDETTIGYDLVGIEMGGSFHSFHCHGIGVELTEKFGLTLNQFGLFDYCADWKPVLDAFKNGEIGVEPVPWFVAKIKQIFVENRAG